MATQHYSGGCQCGAVTFEVDADLETAKICNCSRCQRLGWVIAFVPRSQFTLKTGDEALSEYRFNTGRIQHLFCSTCGIQSFAYGSLRDGTPMTAINVNCLEGVDPRSLTPQFIDGRSL